MMAHFAQCNASGLEVPDYFQAMLIMTKLPSSFDGLAQLFCQKEHVKTLDIANMRKTVIVMTFWYVFGTDLTFFELFKLLLFTWD